MSFIRFLLFILIGYLVFKVVKALFIRPSDNPHVKGNQRKNDSIQNKYSDRIEDADYEDIE